jgi:gas vesicle protein
MDDHRSNGTSDGASYSALTFSFLVGGITGAAAALLLAPQAGKATRGLMGRKLHEAAASARELKGRAVRRGRRIREEATHRVEGAAAALAGTAGQNERGRESQQGQ